MSYIRIDHKTNKLDDNDVLSRRSISSFTSHSFKVWYGLFVNKTTWMVRIGKNIHLKYKLKIEKIWRTFDRKDKIYFKWMFSLDSKIW